jgi:acyl dehydratase
MPYLASRVGHPSGPFTTEVTKRDILAYSAGLGVSDPCYLDDARPGGVEALPFQSVSLEWPVVVAERAANDTGLSPSEVGRQVHAIQDSIYHRPLKAGNVVDAFGKIVEARENRAGVLTVAKLDTIDQATGEPIATSWSTVIYRQAALEGDPVCLDSAPPLPVDPALPLPADATLVTVHVPRQLPHIYTECAHIWNPVHTEREAALEAGLPDIILQGTATWALAGLEIMRAYGEQDHGDNRLAMKRFTGRFVGMVIPGTDITIRHALDPSDPKIIRYEVLTEDGKRAIDQGVAILG